MTKEELTKMLEEWKQNGNYLTKVAKEIVFNSNESVENRHFGLMILLDDARNRKTKIEHGIRRMESFLKSLYDVSLKEHKKKRIIEFTQKWEGKDVCEEMAEEMRRIEKPNHCYQFNGIIVVELDCNMCKSRKCEQGDKDYVPNKFEDLLKIMTPEGTHSVIDDSVPEGEVENGTTE